jgi:HK97 family phage prohead protease
MNQTRYTKAIIEKTGEEITAIASTEAVDRQGEIVEVAGWDLKDFKANPVILWGHDHSLLPIGNATKTWVEGSGKNAKLMVKIMFQEVTEMGRAVKQLVNDGVLKTLSVGFQPIDAEDNRYTKQKLLEISVVNVPANPQAMMLGYKSLKDAGFSDETITDAGIPAAMVQEVTIMKQKMDSLEVKLDSAVNGLKYLNPQQGRSDRIVTERLSMVKASARAADIILTNKAQPTQTLRSAKTIKLASDKIISSLKGELKNGTN